MQETCKRWGFHLWVRKIPWRRKWQPPPDSCLGIPHTEEPGGPQGHRVRQDWSNLARTTRGSIRVKDGCPEKKIFCCLLNSSNPWIAENVALWKGKGGHERNPSTVPKTTCRGSRNPGLPASYLFPMTVILQFVFCVGPLRWAGAVSAGLGTCCWGKSQESRPVLFSTSGTRT